MTIKEVCRLTGLTKKAVQYYQQNGLIAPAVEENGYKNYTQQDVATLKEIALLRALGVGVQETRQLLASADKRAAAAQLCRAKERQIEQQQEQRRWLAVLAERYDVEDVYDRLLAEDHATIQQRLSQAFPGTLGDYFSWHFGRFLTHKVETESQRTAYQSILQWLDDMEFPQIPPELLEAMEGTLPFMRQAGTAFLESLEDFEGYLQQNHQTLEAVQQWRTSPEYENSPGGKLQKLLTEFQRQSGYTQVFLKNMQVLSPSYAAYVQKLEKANVLLMQHYPKLKQLYEEP